MGHSGIRDLWEGFVDVNACLSIVNVSVANGACAAFLELDPLPIFPGWRSLVGCEHNPLPSRAHSRESPLHFQEVVTIEFHFYP